jgi:chemotaxis protein MotA
MKIDISTILGTAIAFGLVFMGMILACGGDLALLTALFINQPSSAAITIGGSIGGTMMCFPMGNLKRLGAILGKSAMEDSANTAYGELVNELVDFATEARRNGVLALDARTEDIQDDFIKQGIQLAVDGTAPEHIEEILSLDLEYMSKRHEDNQALLLKWGELAPAFGMIGTLVGLIAMLADLSDPDSIGPSMAIALITTLYGSMLANMFCIPLAGKLANRTKEEVVRKEIIIAAILAIQNGDNPRIVKQKLLTYVTQDVRDQVAETSEGEGAA